MVHKDRLIYSLSKFFVREKHYFIITKIILVTGSCGNGTNNTNDSQKEHAKGTKIVLKVSLATEVKSVVEMPLGPLSKRVNDTNHGNITAEQTEEPLKELIMASAIRRSQEFSQGRGLGPIIKPRGVF